MVSEKLQKTLDFIGATNSDIARYAKLDTSLVSRIKSGSRKVSINSRTMVKIANGIYMFCDDKNMIRGFCSLFGGRITESREESVNKFLMWLYEGAENETYAYKPQKTTRPSVNISSKLDKLMTLTDTSNIRLARTINVDSSYISRIRNGLRTPKSNIALMKNISAAITDKIITQNKAEEAAALMGVPCELIFSSENPADEIFAWLCGTDRDDFIPAAEILIDKIESFSISGAAPPADIPFEAENIPVSDVYRGTEGLRQAVMRFLSDTISSDISELFLYSDQDMSWMVGDEKFRSVWLTLMDECAKRGTKIKIIHNIDRNLNEMISAITSWLPIYMFGTMEPYYCTKRTDDRFSHTIFLSRSRACIRAQHVRGYEGDGFYDYFTDTERLKFISDEYDGLLKISKPLVRLYGADYAVIPDRSAASDECTVRESLSLATMPYDLLEAILKRNGIPRDKQERIKKIQNAEKNHFFAALKNGYVHELIPQFGSMTEFPCAALDSIYYTPSELSRHIKNILDLMDEYANYRIYLLPEAPFTNIRLTVDSEDVIASRIKEPRMSFVFSHPLVRSAFDNYVSQLRERCDKEKNAVRKILRGYI